MEKKNYNPEFFAEALNEAKKGYAEGGIPIGSVVVYNNKIIGRGHNRRVQDKSPILHAEIDALRDAGRQTTAVYAECTLYTTLSPCAMCSGAILLYKIPRVVIGENRTFMGSEELLKSEGVEITLLDDRECFNLMQKFIAENPHLWSEDIGE
ncbi:MAG: nucleoside deaminase [Dehalococcoidales bacterium]|nr:nucleoside deaminase [Dehalococcoidales bacterium]